MLRSSLILLFIFVTTFVNSETLKVAFVENKNSPIFDRVEIFFEEVGDKIDGLNFKIIYLPHQRAKRQLILGNIAADFARTSYVYDGEEEVLRVDVPILNIPHVGFVKDRRIIFDGPESLRSYSLIAVKGNESAARYAAKHNLELSYSNTYESCFKLINGGRYDIFIGAAQNNSHLTEGSLKNLDITMLTTPFYYESVYMFLSKKSEKYLKLLEETLKVMGETGRTEDLFTFK